MAKILKCRDVGLDCGWEGRADSEEELLQKGAEHARDDHGMESIPEDQVAKIRAAIRDE